MTMSATIYQDDPQSFIDDLVDYEEGGKMLGMEPRSIPIQISRGKLPLTRYRRGKKKNLSRREIVAHMKATATPPPITGTEESAA
jgi:hypothetical protein